MQRKWPVGAEWRDGAFDLRVWAPDQARLSVLFHDGRVLPMQQDDAGYCHISTSADFGATYQLLLSDGTRVADPASKFQPDGPHGPSQIVDGSRFAWTDQKWTGRPISECLLYEMHIGTFTPEGTWAAAARELPELAAAGITALEVMPVADFPGRFGWGYDGVNLFAPTRLYGTPDDFRRFVDMAHQHGISVLLDVVYNHLGPDGNHLDKLSRHYFSTRYKTEWGEPLNFDGPHCQPVREFYTTNAAYWIDEFHLDGLRLDATQAIFDESPPERHILTDITRAGRQAGQGRQIVIIAENEPQHSALCRPVDRGGYGLDGLWNDDFHHSAIVAMTGRREAYYNDYLGSPQEFVSAAKYGYLYQGQWYSWQNNGRGQPGFDLPPEAFVTFTQNHDQVANSGQGLRIHQLTSPARYRVFLALQLLSPGTPLLFQGQEFCASTPFLYFADHHSQLAPLVAKGRREFLAQFPSLTDPAAIAALARPDDPQTFERCKLDFRERTTHAAAYDLCRDLMHLRHQDPAFQADQRLRFDGAVLGPEALVLRYFLRDEADRLLVLNWGHELRLDTLPEPLVAPPAGKTWHLQFATESIKYGGAGVAWSSDGPWRLTGESAVWLTAQ